MASFEWKNILEKRRVKLFFVQKFKTQRKGPTSFFYLAIAYIFLASLI